MRLGDARDDCDGEEGHELDGGDDEEAGNGDSRRRDSFPWP